MDGPRNRASRVRAAVKAWKAQLVDLGGRNTLLFYRDQKVGTLDLTGARPEALDALLAGRSVRMTSLFPGESERNDAANRLRRIHSKAREHYEERGIETLYLGCGLASWKSNTNDSTPCAPVLLRPLLVTPKGASRDEFDLILTGDMEINPTLLYRLKSEFAQELDRDQLQERLDGAIDTKWELEATFEWLQKNTTRVPQLSIAQRLVVGNFSYAKLPMVTDLEASESTLIHHDLIAAIAGDQEARNRLNAQYDAVHVSLDQPDQTPPADEFLVVDADASQSYAINAVLGGQDLIIQGPPGTGKSQTIANLIATALARGQTVLFVAEKRAAIDAVFKRLRAVRLDGLLLDLHGEATSRRQIAETLSKSLALVQSTPLESHTQVFDDLVSRRRTLNQAAHASIAVRKPWGISVLGARMAVAAVPDAARTSLRLRGAAIDRVDAAKFRSACQGLEALAGLGAFSSEVLDSMWSRSKIDAPDLAMDAFVGVERFALELLPHAQGVWRDAFAEAGCPEPHTLLDCGDTIAAWQAARTGLICLRPEVFEEDLAQLLGAFAPAGRRPPFRLVARLFNGAYKASRQTVRGHLLDAQTSDSIAWSALVAASRAQEMWRALGVPGRPAPPARLDEASNGLVGVLQEHAALEAMVGPLGGQSIAIASLEALLRDLVADRTVVLRLPEIRRLTRQVSAPGLAPLLDELSRVRLDPDLCLARLDYVWNQSIVEQIEFADPRVGHFDGSQHARVVDQYRRADATHIATTASRIRRLYAERAVSARDRFRDEAALVTHQAALKRGHLPLRRLFSSAPNVLLALKPCWAMSPLMVSQVLPSDRQYFDLVVFDEASQVLPADAIPAIMRARRVVVAGDDRQLPPTTFFASQAIEDDAEAEELALELASTTGFESILKSLSPLLRSRMLTWHYRSRDERLIAFSNVHFYDRSLTTFPGTSHSECVEHVLVPFRPGPPGQEKSSTDEVREVVKRIIDHAVHRPNESLGVIALGITHANRIEEALRLELRDHQDLNDFFSESREEPFFVKNLERVQGDERDAIILSVGYGKTSDGRLLYRFGPINVEGGERRLNVAVTRAKRRLMVVSSFSSADMDPSRLTSRGATLLRDYLRYAESCGSDLGAEALGKPELNPFEIDVKGALESLGIAAVPQLGASGYRVDFAAQHPDRPGEYVLAIECDGASYHSSPTARDRDRLRQEHLERLGWRFHRIWSSDWMRNRQRALDGVAAAYRDAVAEADRPREQRPTAAAPAATPARSAAKPGAERSPAVAPPRARGPRPWVTPGCYISYYSQPKLILIVDWIESDTLLRTEDQLLAEVMTDLHFMRRGDRIVTAITAAIREARRGRSSGAGH